MSDPHLRSRLDHWVAAGLIDPDQAVRIEAAEALSAGDRAEPEAEPAAARPPLAEPVSPPAATVRGGRSHVVEAVGYLGATLAVIAGFLAVDELWPDIPWWAQLAFAGVSTVALLGAGAAVRVERDPALERLRAVLWVLSAVSLCWLTDVLARRVPHWEPSMDSGVLEYTVATAYEAVLWRRSRAPLQQLAVFLGLLLVVFTAILAIDEYPAAIVKGIGIWSVSALWAAAAYRQLIRPRTVALPAAAAGLVLGATMMLDDAAGHVLALCTVGLIIAAGVRLGQVWLLGIGALGVLGVVPKTATRYLPHSAGAPVAVFAVGLTLLGIALWLGRPRQRGES